MGCDIHCFVERRTPGGAWEVIKMGAISNKLREHLKDDPEELEYMERRAWMFDIDRDYFLFAVLADVRNYWRGDNIEEQGCQVIPISEPKGLPEDVTEKVKKTSDDFGTDGHSHSYLTLEEIMKYNWVQIRICEEALSDKEYKHYLTYGEIETEDIHVLDNDIIDILTPEQKEKLSDMWQDYILHRIKKRVVYYTYAHCCRAFLNVKVPILIEKLGEINNPNYEDIRLVFWFDN